MTGLIVGASISIGVVIGFVWILCATAAKPAPKPVKAVIGQWHDYIAMNQHGYILDPTPEESDRMLRESRIELAEGRPTMPSEIEPQSETERRTR
jgi:hypothetical protein